MTGKVLLRARCTVEAVNLRINHSSTSPILGRVEVNEIVDVYRVYKGWYQKTDGLWCHGRYFEILTLNTSQCNECPYCLSNKLGEAFTLKGLPVCSLERITPISEEDQKSTFPSWCPLTKRAKVIHDW